MAVLASTAGEASELLAELVWLVLLAGTLAGAGAFLYRWYVREESPAGLSLLVGLAGVTVYLNTSRALGQVIAGSTLPTEREVALFNIGAFALATGAALLGRRVGDRLGADVALQSDVQGVDREVGRLVETVGRVIAVELPEEIEDVVGYDPVPEETKKKLAGRTFLFPRRLTVSELRERLVSRLTADYAVGTVDVDLAADGTVEYLALGSRAAGIGPTLPSETNAVAVRADPAFAASAGDLVQVWETDPPKRRLTAELRGVADDVVTLAIDAADTTKVDPITEYRLVTLPVGDRPDREFASLLRAADETFSSVVVAADSPLDGLPIGALDVAVIAVKPEDSQAVALPEPARVLAPGDRVFAIARAEALRRLETAAKPLDSSVVPDADSHSPTETTPEPDADEDGSPDDSGAEPVSADRETGGRADEEREAEDRGGDNTDPVESEPVAIDDLEPLGGDVVDDLDSLETDGEDEDDDLASLDVGGETDALDLAEDIDDEFGDSLDGDDPFEEDELFGDVDGSDEEGGNEETDDGDADGEDGDRDEDGDEDEDEDGDEDEDEDEGDDAEGGGGKSFQELKEEFESGEADWDDDVSDSPGGDMRLDE